MIDTDYAYKDIEECEAIYGYKVGPGFKLGWDMARITTEHGYKNIEECEALYGEVTEAFRIGWTMSRTTNKNLSDLAKRSGGKMVDEH